MGGELNQGRMHVGERERDLGAPWPGSKPWSECKATGYYPDTPPWIAGWLVVIVDNVMHILINGLAIAYFAS